MPNPLYVVMSRPWTVALALGLCLTGCNVSQLITPIEPGSGVAPQPTASPTPAPPAPTPTPQATPTPVATPKPVPSASQPATIPLPPG